MYLVDTNIFLEALLEQEKTEIVRKFLSSTNVIIDGLNVISLNERELRKVNEASKSFNLDFDDAYQYTVAEKHNLQIISFDRDFDHTLRKRKEPTDII